MAVLISVTEGDVTQIVLADVGVQGATGPSSPASGTPFTPYGNIAATNVQTAIQELDDEKFGKAGGTVTGNLEIGTGGTLSFEGATADGFETTLAVVDPTADRTLTLPNVTGTFVTTGDTGTVTSTMLLDGTILNADVNASAAIAGTKISPDFGSQTIVTTGVHSAAAGSTAAPSIAFTGDLDTGIYSPGANQVAISTNGTGRLFVNATGSVGVGIGSPIALGKVLNIYGGASEGSSIALESNSGSEFCTIFSGATAADPTSLFSKSGFKFGIATAKDATGFSEKMRLTSAGLLGLGTSSPQATLHATGAILSSDTLVALSASNIFFDQPTSALSRIGAVGANTSTAGTLSISQYSSNGSVGRDVVNINSSGYVGIGTTSPSSLLHLADAGNITVGTTTGTKIGTATTQKLGFYNATPVVQPTAVADATTAIDVITQLNALLAKLRTLGIIAT